MRVNPYPIKPALPPRHLQVIIDIKLHNIGVQIVIRHQVVEDDEVGVSIVLLRWRRGTRVCRGGIHVHVGSNEVLDAAATGWTEKMGINLPSEFDAGGVDIVAGLESRQKLLGIDFAERGVREKSGNADSAVGSEVELGWKVHYAFHPTVPWLDLLYRQ